MVVGSELLSSDCFSHILVRTEKVKYVSSLASENIVNFEEQVGMSITLPYVCHDEVSIVIPAPGKFM